MRFGEFEIRTARHDEFYDLADMDDDSAALFKQVGLDFSALTATHPYVVLEREQWTAAIDRGWAYIAVDAAGHSAGMIVLDLMDGAPYLEQLSVRMRAMRRGLGTALLQHALRWARSHGDDLWLTTYGHIPWNRPYYERAGFAVVPEPACGPQMQACLAAQRVALPAPEHRVAMRRPAFS